MDGRLHERGIHMSSAEIPARGGRHASTEHEPRHIWWLVGIWLALSLAACLVIWFIWYPHLPPGDMTTTAHDQQFDIAVLAVSAAPVILGVFCYFGYALVAFRAKQGDDSDGEPIYGNVKVQASWIIGTTLIVLWLFAFGTVELIVPAGAGAGEGASPIWKLAGAQTATWTPGTNDMLQVQVIGQQWVWTYRYPQFGGMESTVLDLPVNTPITFHVTSLDVIHSFWPYLLAVKADANPAVDNVAYTTAKQLGSFTVRCNELCGIWHADMTSNGNVMTQTAFKAWATGVQAREKANGTLAALPPFSLTYDPTVIPQLGKNLVNIIGVTGAAGYFYGPGNPVTP
jgi:cytochrome c oxidase subunit II